jgi:hypothetical protein
MDKGKIHGIAIFLAQHERKHTWTRNEWEVWTICSNIFHEAYWTQNLVQEETILTKNEYEIVDVLWWQLNSKPKLCLF